MKRSDSVDFEFRIADCGITDVGFGMWDVRCWILDFALCPEPCALSLVPYAS